MSGPIVRKYGFPNHEKIFGARPIEHGVDEAGPGAEPPAPEVEEKKPAAKPKAKPAAKPKGAKK